MKHAYVKDGQITATGTSSVRAAMVLDGKGSPDDAWFKTADAADKKAVGVYEVVDLRPGPQPDFVDTVPLALVYDAGADTVTQPYALQEWELERARTEVKRRITDLHRDCISNGSVDLAGNTFAAHNDAYNELEEAVERAESAPFVAVTRAGDVVTFDLATAQAALAAVDAYRNACVDREAALYLLADAATTVADLRAINIKEGWPT